MLTSGSTGRPKLVPMTHANVVASSLHIAAHYGLTAADRCLVLCLYFTGTD
jgi:acyl-CoA synthetase (AMP-forming)/AMP-acid ligase II